MEQMVKNSVSHFQLIALDGALVKNEWSYTPAPCVCLHGVEIYDFTDFVGFRKTAKSDH